MPTEISVTKRQQRGQTLTRSFGIVTKNLNEEMTTDPIIVNNLVLVKFAFQYVANHGHPMTQLESEVWLKKIPNTNPSMVRIKLSCEWFEEEELILTCPEDWSATKLESTYRDFCLGDTFISYRDTSIILLESKTTSLQKQKIYEDEDLVDFYLCAPDGKVGIQKAFLGLHSEVFMMMLKREWKETLEDEICIVGVTKRTLQDLKQYVYLGTLPDEGLESLLLIATRYMMDELTADCIAKIIATLTPEKMDYLVEYACLNNLPNLMKAILFEATEYNIKGMYELKIKKNKAIEESSS